MNPEGWIVLAVGIATVLSQVWAAKQQRGAADAVLRAELVSVLVVAKGAYSTHSATLHVHNGGRYPAIDVHFELRDASGEPIGAGRTPIVQPATSKDVGLSLGTKEKRDAYAGSETIDAQWSDGVGSRAMSLRLLPWEE